MEHLLIEADQMWMDNWLVAGQGVHLIVLGSMHLLFTGLYIDQLKHTLLGILLESSKGHASWLHTYLLTGR